ncbi:30S ribosomal protein S5 [Candidatus Vidania fulgoroideorum]
MVIKFKKLIYSRKTSFVRKGGRNFRYTAYTLVSNGKNKIGIEKSKSNNLSSALQKSFFKSKKNIIKLNIKKETIPKEVSIKVSKTFIKAYPCLNNEGLLAGGCLRLILSYTGIKNINCKIYGSKNKINVIKASKKLLKYFSYEKKKIRKRKFF